MFTRFLNSDGLDRFYEIEKTEAALIDRGHLHWQQGHRRVDRLQELLRVRLENHESKIGLEGV